MTHVIFEENTKHTKKYNSLAVDSNFILYYFSLFLAILILDCIWQSNKELN